jgi:predicted acylesterase/phospholipase RssA
MRLHLLYIASPAQLADVRNALVRLSAKELPESAPLKEVFEFQHRLLGQQPVQINLLSEIDTVSAHLRHFPVDLLIYDERGTGGIPAVQAISQIKKEVQALGDLWGPDFIFPMSRVVAILEEKQRDLRVFELGRLHVRDVCLAPKGLIQVLLWLKDVLWRGIIREEKVGIALGGGGIEGFLYQLGVLYALELAITGEKPLRKADIISGISSGAIAGALFATGFSLQEVIKSLQSNSDVLPSLTSNTIFDLAASDISKRFLKQSVSWKGLDRKKWIDMTFKSIPTGFFRGERLEEYFRTFLEVANKEDSFSALDTELLIGATNHDTFEHVVFGIPPWDKVPISEAIRASVALPPVFTPKRINDHNFIDGQITRSSNLELLVERGSKLVVVVNPLKPFSSSTPGFADQEGGLFTIIQTIKALVSTRFETTLKHAADKFRDVDFIVFEPDAECARLMAGSPMKYRIRTQLVHLAFHSTLRKLRERYTVYSAKFSKYGFTLKSADDLKTLGKTYDQIFPPTD